jgi:hypothetical protein
LLQNGKFNSAIKNIAAQYTIGNDLIYNTIPKPNTLETNFCILKIKIFELPIITSHELPEIYNYIRIMRPYSPKILMVICAKFNVSDSSIEADYAWVYFSLSAPLLIMTTKSISTGCLTIIV